MILSFTWTECLGLGKLPPFSTSWFCASHFELVIIKRYNRIIRFTHPSKIEYIQIRTL